MRARAILALLALVLGLVVVPFSLAGVADGIALLYYLLAVAGIVLGLLIATLGRLLPRAQPIAIGVAEKGKPDSPVDQLERISRAIDASVWSAAQLHESLRPVVREIVAERLARNHGIDLYRSPERARSLIGGGKAWELARPDRSPPSDPAARGWPLEEIDELLDELEAL